MAGVAIPSSKFPGAKTPQPGWGAGNQVILPGATPYASQAPQPQVPQAPAPIASAPYTPAAVAPMAASFSAGAPLMPPATPSVGGPDPAGGAKVIAPDPAPMAGLQSAMGGGGGDYESAGPGAQLSGPTMFRNGIGSRIPPNLAATLAGLRRAY